jgi:predicted small integral membrane protein
MGQQGRTAQLVAMQNGQNMSAAINRNTGVLSFNTTSGGRFDVAVSVN